VSNSTLSMTNKKLFPIMLELTGFIGSFIGIFFSVYYIKTRGLAGAIDVGVFWVVESLCLPLSFAGLFFEKTFQENKRITIYTKESSVIFLSFSIMMFILHYGKYSLDTKLAVTATFLFYLLFSSIFVLIDSFKTKVVIKYKILHVILCFMIVSYSFYFGFKFLL